MTTKNKERLNLALLNAAEFIRSHAEVGLEPEDVNEEDETGLKQYTEMCIKASNIIRKISQKYKD